MHIFINRISEVELLEYLKETPLAKELDIKAYTYKVYPLATFFTIVENNRVIAINIVYFNDESTLRGYITYIHVSKEHRGKGLGRKLLRIAAEYGQNHGFKRIALEVKKKNEIAKRLYTKFGFVYYAETETSYYMQYTIF